MRRARSPLEPPPSRQSGWAPSCSRSTSPRPTSTRPPLTRVCVTRWWCSRGPRPRRGRAGTEGDRGPPGGHPARRGRASALRDRKSPPRQHPPAAHPRCHCAGPFGEGQRRPDHLISAQWTASIPVYRLRSSASCRCPQAPLVPVGHPSRCMARPPDRGAHVWVGLWVALTARTRKVAGFARSLSHAGWWHHGDMHEVLIDPVPLQRLGRLLTSERAERLEAAARAAGKLLNGRVVWNVNATAQGGGVAEILQALLAYGRGAGIDTRWRVLGADPEFFAITKRLHNRRHGSRGDGGELGEAERRHDLEVSRANLAAAADLVRPGDIVLLHDPQTAGMVTGLRDLGGTVVWRCHIGADTATPVTEAGWAFLREFVEPADAVIFSRIEYVPEWVANDKVWVIPPSLDPF